MNWKEMIFKVVAVIGAAVAAVAFCTFLSTCTSSCHRADEAKWKAYYQSNTDIERAKLAR